MTQSQKLSLIVTTEKEIRDRVNHLLTSGGTAIVQFSSDTAKDQVAEKKFLRLRGHDWRYGVSWENVIIPLYITKKCIIPISGHPKIGFRLLLYFLEKSRKIYTELMEDKGED